MSFQVEPTSSCQSSSSRADKREIETELSNFPKIDFHILSPASSYYSFARNFYYDEVERLGEKPRKFSQLTADDSRVQCELMLANENPVGMIVHRKVVKETCSYDKASNIFEVELCELSKKEDSPQYREKLVDRLISLGKKIGAQSVHLSLSKQSKTLAEEFRSRGFSIFSSDLNDPAYSEKDHLYYPLNPMVRGIASLTKEAEALSQFFKRPNPAPLSYQSEEDHNRKRKRDSKDSASLDPSLELKFPEDKRPRQGSFFRGHEKPGPVNARSQSAGPCRPSMGEGAKRSHELTLRKMYIHQIRNGQKTVEGRIFSGVVLKYQPGDKIRFFYHHNPYDDVRCTIAKIERYGSFREMLEKIGYKKCLAEVSSLSDAVRVYDSIPNYKERAGQHGVAAIHLAVD